MRHRATIWAIQQRGLKLATKIVLWFLCDRHNPDFGCFPTQARLSEDFDSFAHERHPARIADGQLTGIARSALGVQRQRSLGWIACCDREMPVSHG